MRAEKAMEVAKSVGWSGLKRSASGTSPAKSGIHPKAIAVTGHSSKAAESQWLYSVFGRRSGQPRMGTPVLLGRLAKIVSATRSGLNWHRRVTEWTVAVGSGCLYPTMVAGSCVRRYAEAGLRMKTETLTILMMFLAVTTIAAQAQSDTAATAPITGIDSTALAGSARASRVIGSKVYKGDTAVGQIEDVLISLDHATVTAVVLSVGGFLGLREKLVAIPVNQIKVSSEAKFTTELTKEQLAAAPAFDFGKLK